MIIVYIHTDIFFFQNPCQLACLNFERLDFDFFFTPSYLHRLINNVLYRVS